MAFVCDRIASLAEAFASKCAKLDPQVKQQFAEEGMDREDRSHLTPNY